MQLMGLNSLDVIIGVGVLVPEAVITNRRHELLVVCEIGILIECDV
jgi:hypothetical protein